MSYHAPQTLHDALGAIAAHGGARIVAGGTDVFPALGDSPPPADFIDLTRVAELRGITRRDDGGWRIGAAVTWREAIRADLPPCFDGLKAAAREVGSVQIQTTGTLAGNLCNASPAADGVPALMALDATVELAAREGTRHLPLGEFLTGVRRTALRPGEIVAAIHVPPQPESAQSAFLKLGSRKYLVISIVMVSTVIWRDGGRIAGARIAVGAASPVAQRLPELEAVLVGLDLGGLDGALTRPEHLSGLSPIADVRGSADYRRLAVAELCDRAIRKAAHG
ncbi:FAD binding domain-containing protein [Oceaniglobus indicus]|uniref:FAD binding domain-containing protein n=1 Tax=Oceaniglobus indicus TaxID=2047749 RepID=UPI000C187E81|nr:xanthine dehydrogenase family protein subunit M [Oceaniglobus indicus]